MTIKDIVLLLVPTAISLASFYVSALAYRRDTSKLKVDANYSVALNAHPTLAIVVSNVGKRATTIMEAGYRVNHQFHLNFLEARDDRSKRDAVAVVDIKLIDEYTAIGPGEVRRFTLTLDHWPNFFVHADMPLIPYAKDVSGKFFYGSQHAYLRRLLNSGWSTANIPKKFYEPVFDQIEPLRRRDLNPSSSLAKVLDNLSKLLTRYLVGVEPESIKRRENGKK